VPLVIEIAKRFQARQPGTEVIVRSGGSGKGVADVRAGASDIGMVSRPLFGAERELQAFPIARDGVAMIAHRDNPVSNVTLAQLQNVITGRVAAWKQLGGRDAPIKLIWRGEGQGSVGLLLGYLELKSADVKRPHDIIVENKVAIDAVAASPHAIAPMSVGEAERRRNAGTAIKLLQVDGVEPSALMILNGQYPLARPLSLVTAKLPEGAARAFIDYALSPAVADLIRKYDFVPYND
jgi:phosphate transport system substrate-binding protein